MSGKMIFQRFSLGLTLGFLVLLGACKSGTNLPKTQPAAEEAERLTSKQEKLVTTARSYLGTPHQLGGQSKKGTDCSGLMIMTFQQIGIQLPRVSHEQAQIGKAVKVGELEIGDLVFFTFPGENRISHVGMITRTSNGQQATFIHASKSRGVREDELFSDYWKKIFVKARRVL